MSLEDLQRESIAPRRRVTLSPLCCQHLQLIASRFDVELSRDADVSRDQMARLPGVLRSVVNRVFGSDDGNAIRCVIELDSETADTDESSGTALLAIVEAFDIDWESLSARLLLYVCQPYRRSGKHIEGVAAFLDYVFCEFGLRKLYFDVEDSVIDQSLSTLGSIAVEEVRLTDHMLTGDGFATVRTYGITADEWLNQPLRHRAFSNRSGMLSVSGFVRQEFDQTVDSFVAALRKKSTIDLPEDVNPYESLLDLGVDSIQVYELLACTEELAGFGSSFDKLPELLTLSDFYKYYWTCRNDVVPHLDYRRDR